MDADLREAVLDRAEDLLPKYGGFVEGALNQALILLGNPAYSKDELKKLADELHARKLV